MQRTHSKPEVTLYKKQIGAYGDRLLTELTCPCSPVVKSLECHVQQSMIFAVAGVRFEPQPVRVRLLKELFQIIPMHMVIREIISSRKTGLNGVLYKL